MGLKGSELRLMGPHATPGGGPTRGIPRAGHGSRRLASALVVGWLLVIAVGGWAVLNSQSSSRRAVAGRVVSRTQYSASFISLYLRDLLARDRAAAQAWLSGAHVSRATLENTSAALGLRAAALTDAHAPAGASAPRISLGEVGGKPAIVFAVDYATPSGEREFSGTYAMSDTALSTVLGHTFAMPGWRASLIDSHGARVSAGPGSDDANPLHFSAAVPGIEWKLAVTVPPNELYGFFEGAGRWVAWLALAGLGAAGLAVIFLFVRLQRRRAQLGMLNGELARLAAVDPLTGLRNRREIEQYLSEALSAARRHELALSLLVIDVDHFKTFNDRFGHQQGDAILAHTARALDGALRAEDAIGRWGGEEFLVVLPGTDEDGAMSVTERLRTALATDQPPEARGHELPVTIPIGLAEWRQETVGELINRADGALYQGKAAGRDTVHVSGVRPSAAQAPDPV